MPFDLPAYLERIRLPAAPAPDAAGLRALQRAHRLAIPFENLDVILGRAIRIDADAVFAKLVTARRGGDGFEHGRLFEDALAALGFAARPLLARAWAGQADVPPLSHTLSLVTIAGQEWIADAGFAGGYCPPMPLADGADAPAPDGALFRLERDPVHGWLLRRRSDGVTAEGADVADDAGLQYGFTSAPVFPADLALGSRWCSTSPGAQLTGPVVSLVLPGGFASLTGRAYRRRNGAARSEARIDDPRQYRMRLSLLFGIDLSPAEVAALGLFGRQVDGAGAAT